MITLEQIRKRLVEAIEQSEMTQTAIAAALNVKPTQICSNLCKIFDVDANYILCQ